MTRQKPIKDISTTCRKQQELIQQIVNPSISMRHIIRRFSPFLYFRYVVGELKLTLYQEENYIVFLLLISGPKAKLHLNHPLKRISL
jgi:hypothetical protein